MKTKLGVTTGLAILGMAGAAMGEEALQLETSKGFYQGKGVYFFVDYFSFTESFDGWDDGFGFGYDSFDVDNEEVGGTAGYNMGSWNFEFACRKGSSDGSTRWYDGSATGLYSYEEDGTALEFKVKKTMLPWLSGGLAYEYGQVDINQTLNLSSFERTDSIDGLTEHALRPHVELFYVLPISGSLSFAPKMIASYLYVYIPEYDVSSFSSYSGSSTTTEDADDISLYRVDLTGQIFYALNSSWTLSAEAGWRFQDGFDDKGREKSGVYGRAGVKYCF